MNTPHAATDILDDRYRDDAETLTGVKTDVSLSDRHRVVIVGCGFGGLFAACALRRADVDVTVIDRTNQPERECNRWVVTTNTTG